MTENCEQNATDTSCNACEEKAAQAVKQNPRKGFYILPNLFTLAALFAGFYAIVMAMNGVFVNASIAIFFAMVLDGFDGRIARLTGTASDFGEQFDSLSDMVSFGAAPALVMYVWALKDFGKLGWVVAFVYCACGAMRLARFNANIGVVDKRFFQGLASPAAAAIVAGFVWMNEVAAPSGTVSVIALLLTLFAGLSMVSNIPFYSFKVFNFRKSVSFFRWVAFGLVFALFLALFAYSASRTLFTLFMAYGLSGYIYYIVNRIKGNKVNVVNK